MNPIDKTIDRRQKGQAEGESLKREKHKLLKSKRASYVRCGQRALLGKLLEGTVATADDVYAAVALPPGIEPRCLGAVPGSLAKAGIIRLQGYTKPARPMRHASVISIWELADKTAAETWLKANPDLLDDQQKEPPATDIARGSVFPTQPSTTNGIETNG